MITSEYQLEKLLIDVGRKLIVPPYYVGEFRCLLNKLVYNLSKVGPFPSQFMQDALGPSMIALISPRLLRHPNIDVRVLVALCLCEILRITAPSPFYSDEQMQEVFQVIVATFGTLFPEYKYYYTSFAILHKVARTKLCLMMLNLRCNELFIEMFQYFLTVAQFHCPDNMFANMEDIMTMVLQESNDISKELLYPLLDSVRKKNGNVGSLSWQLGEQVLTNCADKLKPYLMKVVQSLGFDLNDYAPIVAFICRERSGANLVEVTPRDYSLWESMMKLLQDMNAKLKQEKSEEKIPLLDPANFNSPTRSENKCLTPQVLPLAISLDVCSNQKAIFDEPKPMQQDIDSPHELAPTVQALNLSIEVVTEVDNLCVEPLPAVDYSCAANAISLEIQGESNESMAQEIVPASEEFEEVTKDLGIDLTPIVDNSGVEEIVVQESHPKKANLSECGVYPSNLLKI